MPTHSYTPVVRAALLAALNSPTHSLKRARGGYIAFGEPIKTSAATPIQAFTRRAVNKLEREGLAQFDEPDFPTVVTLTTEGVTAAQQLLARSHAVPA